MWTLSQLGQELQRLLTTQADELACQTGWTQRTSKLTGAAFAQALIFGWLNDPDATLAQLAQMAATAHVTITPQGLDQRFTEPAAEFLRCLLEAAVTQVVSAEPTTSVLLQRFTGVYVLDGSTIPLPEALMTLWPGCTGAALKIQVQLDLLTGALRGPFLQPGRAHDRGAPYQEDFPPGALRLADLGYFHLETLARLSAAAIFWLSRLQAQVHVYATDGQLVVLEERLSGHAVVDLPVQLGAQRLPARLIAIAVPDEVAAARRQHLREEAQRHGKAVSERQLALAAWTILVTNLPATRLSPPEALVLARLRWQVELLFKLWKDLGKLDESRSHQPWRQLCEVYAKLIVQVIQHWLLLISCWQFPDRSLRQAAQTIQRFATSLLLALPHRRQLQGILREIQRTLAYGCRITRRRQAPSAFQLLEEVAA